jgi:hypothetical protein
MASVDDTPFRDLPEALVEEMLLYCDTLATNLSASFVELRDTKRAKREILDYSQLLNKDAELATVPANPTSCGIDGSYAIERLLSTDMIAVAAVAVEGLTPHLKCDTGRNRVIPVTC